MWQPGILVNVADEAMPSVQAPAREQFDANHRAWWSFRHPLQSHLLRQQQQCAAVGSPYLVGGNVGGSEETS